MTRTSKALRRLGVGVVAAATVLSVAPALGATAASAAGTPLLVANDCTQQSTGTTTTTSANTATPPTTPSNPSTATGAGSGCTTQAQVNTNKTLTFTYTEGGAPVAGRTLDFSIPTNSSATVTNPPTANFPAQQPPGTTSFTGPPPTNFAGQAAQCTTDGNGQCSVNVTDSKAETITVNAKERVSGATAFEYVEFRTNSVSVSRLNEVNRTVVAPENAPSSTTGAAGPAPATPGRPVQLTYTAYDQNGGCGIASAPAGSATCTGAIVRSQAIALKVDNSAYFTPNCTPIDVAGAPRRTGGTAAVPAVGTVAAQPSTGTLDTPNYANCSFTSAPADDAQTSALTRQGQTLNVTTDQNGQFTVTVAEGRDAGFDVNGLVEVNLTATPAGGTALTPRQSGTGTPTGTSCQTVDSSGTASGANVNGAGCNVLPIEFSTRYKALNGSAVSIDPISGPAYSASNPTPDNPGTQAPVFVVHLRDQYGNLTLADGSANNTATLTKTGRGNLSYCGNGPFTSASPCPGNQNPPSQTVNSDGTTTQTFLVRGSFAGNNSNQQRYSVTAEQDVNGNPVDGTATVTAKWVAPVTEFVVGTTANTATGNTVSGFDQSETDNVFTSVVNFAFYSQQAKTITFTVTPGSTVPAGTPVSVTGHVVDQNGNPLQGYPVTFFRSGTSNNCSQTAVNGTGQSGSGITDNLGNATYSFSCADPSTQNVTLVVYNRATSCPQQQNFFGGFCQGAEIGRGTQTVIFTSGTGTPTPTSTATPTGVRGGQGTLDTTTPDIQPNIQGILNASNLTANAVYELECYSRPSTTYFTARTATVAANTSTLQFRILPGTNTRCYIRPQGNDALASNSVVINVHTTLSLSTVRTGTRTYVFQGRNLPRRAGQLITLYRVANGAEIRTSNLTTDSSGIYRVTRTFTGTGTFQFLVRTSQTLTNAPGVSNVITVHVF
ncbi:MAG: hypothetical protein NVS3B26_17680 [Mycobacteriales bacterium]